WKPTAGTTWQIELLYALNDTSANVSVYDIDLFDNPTTTIDTLHSQGRRVVCYFSAGSYEDKRPDSQNFTSKDKGKELDGWPGEYWLNTSSSNVREIMRSRIALAKTKGCDGVDPDNIDGYNNENGLGLTSEGAIDFLTFLAAEAHGRGLAIGLKNGGALVNTVLGIMEWEVNEQCSQYEECDKFRPFVEANKPVFHIEYPGEKDAGAEKVTAQSVCGDAEAKGFSTVLKRLNLDDWLETC
ncbi:glycoside hydrolase superfamily, partial [Bisporella sp. PMI_857]